MDMFKLLAPIAWRNLWRNPRRTFLTLLIVAIGMWAILAFSVMLKAWAASGLEATLHSLIGQGQIHAASYLDDPNVSHRFAKPTGKLLHVLESPAIHAWTPRVRVPAVVQSEYRTRAITLLGVSPSGEQAMSDIPGDLVEGRYLQSVSDPGIVIGSDLAERLKTRMGRRVIIMAQAADGHLAERSYTIVGLFGGAKNVQDAYVFTGRDVAQKQLGIGTDISEISFDSATMPSLNQVVTDLRRAAPTLDIQPWTVLSPLAYTMETFSQSMVGIWLVVMFVLMAIGIVNTQLMAVFERTHEFGLLHALGMRPGLITLQVTIESTLLVGIGVLFGIALLVLTVLPLRGGIDLGFLADAMQAYGFGRSIYPRMNMADTITFSLIIWMLGIVASYWPARTASKANPVVAMGAE